MISKPFDSFCFGCNDRKAGRESVIKWMGKIARIEKKKDVALT